MLLNWLELAGRSRSPPVEAQALSAASTRGATILGGMGMKIRTLREHGNGYGPVYQKHPGRVYDAPDHVAANLIASGLAEDAKTKKTADEKKGD